MPYEEKEKVRKPPGKFAGYGHATVKGGDARPWSEGFYFTDVESTKELAEKVWPENGNADFVYVNFFPVNLSYQFCLHCILLNFERQGPLAWLSMNQRLLSLVSRTS